MGTTFNFSFFLSCMSAFVDRKHVHFSEDFQNLIDSKRKTGSTYPEQMQKMFLVFQKLIPAMDAIRYEYEQ